MNAETVLTGSPRKVRTRTGSMNWVVMRLSSAAKRVVRSASREARRLSKRDQRDVVAKDLALGAALVARLLAVDLKRLAVGPQLGAIDLVYANLLTLGGANLLAINARLAFDSRSPLDASGPLLALDAAGARHAAGARRAAGVQRAGRVRPAGRCVADARHAERVRTARRTFGTLDALPFNPRSSLRTLNLRPLGTRSALALHFLRTLLCTFGPLGARRSPRSLRSR